MHLRLALATILNAKWGQFTVLCGIVCSSWTTINMATSGRTPCSPLGREEFDYISKANMMASRSLDECFKTSFSIQCAHTLYEYLCGYMCLRLKPSDTCIRMHVVCFPDAVAYSKITDGKTSHACIYDACVSVINLTHGPTSPRLALLIMLVEAMSGAWMVEQPHLSMLRFHPRIMDVFSECKEPWPNSFLEIKLAQLMEKTWLYTTHKLSIQCKTIIWKKEPVTPCYSFLWN